MKNERIEMNKLFAMVFLFAFTACGFAGTIAEYAPNVEKPQWAWSYSERPVRIFSPRESLMDPSQMIEEAKRFHATSIRWVYLRLNDAEKKYAAEQNGYAKFGAKLNDAGLAWGGAARSGRVLNRPEAQDRTYLGEYRDYCDTTSPVYRELMVNDIKRYLDGGSVQIHFDEPDRTLGAVIHLKGGGFSETAVAKFREYLVLNAAADQLDKWGISKGELDSGTFDFADFVKDKGGPGAVKSSMPGLWQMFADFHADELKMFYEYVKAESQKYADSIGYGGDVIFTCNNTSLIQLEGAPYDFDVFEYFMGESSAQYSRQSAEFIYEKIHKAKELGKRQYFLASNDWFCVSEQWSPQCIRVPNLFNNEMVVREFTRYLNAVDRAGNEPAKILAARKTLEQRVPGSFVEAVMMHDNWRQLIGTDQPIDPVGRALYVQRSRRLIALTYSLGSATFAPYDRWIRGYDGVTHGVRFFGTYEEFGDLYRFVRDNAKLYEGFEEVFATGDKMGPVRSGTLPADAAPVVLSGGSGDLFACVRAKPGDSKAPVVVHFVDWKADFGDREMPIDDSYGREPFTARLNNEMFGGSVSRPLKMYLLRPGSSPVRLFGRVDGDGYTSFEMPVLQPYAVLTTEM